MEIVSTIDFEEQYVFASALKPVEVPSSKTRLSRTEMGKSKANSGVGSGVEPGFQLLLNFNFIVGGEVLLLLFSTSKFKLNPNFSLLQTSFWI